ncbi:MAG TPA: FAD-binding oxidoreductase [Candidatus Acidoferrum sp.]|nr:FAD-binding oxidoreductase [Candidatus Acidoferrum sp.]
MSIVEAIATAARLEKIVGGEQVFSDPARLAEYTIDGVEPKLVARPENAEQTAEIVRIAVEEKLGVIACGARTSVEVGMPPTGYDIALDMSRVTGIASYDPGDLTISVNAGMPLVELSRTLAAQKQFLPLEVPFFEKATVGGAIAAGLDSPLRHFYGTPRDFLIGAEFVDGTGALAKSGGRVVKNVTGYDFHKLLNGSLGTLAVTTRLNFRTYPVPIARRGFLASFADETQALGFAKEIGDSALTPMLLEILSPECAGLLFESYAPLAALCSARNEWTVCAGFEGTHEVCERYARELSRLARAAAAQTATVMRDEQCAALLEILREAPATMRDATAQAVVMRFAGLPSQVGDLVRALRSFAGSCWMKAPALVRSGSVVYLALLPREDDPEVLKQLEYFWKSVGSLRGKLEFRGTLLFCPPRWKAALNVWEHVAFDTEMERRVKKAFDPNGIFARGRFVGGL